MAPLYHSQIKQHALVADRACPLSGIRAYSHKEDVCSVPASVKFCLFLHECSMMMMFKSPGFIWLVMLLCVLTSVRQNGGEDLCIGSGCSCTEYPVRISCTQGGRPDLIRKMIRRVAVSLEINSNTIQDLLFIDLDEYVSLKTMDVNIYKKDVCFWCADKQKEYVNLIITSPDFCGYLISSYTTEGYTPTTESKIGLTDVGERNIHITINMGHLIVGFLLLSCLSAFGMFRMYIRYVN